MKKVGLFIVGGAKCGTTWVHNMLVQRPDVSLPEQKETNFFAFLGREVDFKGPHDDENTNKHTVRGLAAYQALFRSEAALWVEACPAYLYVPEAAQHIQEYNPDARIVIILRDPIERAWSNYQHLVRDGAEHETFERALALEETRARQGWVWFWDLYRQGLYAEQIARYRALFPEQALLILKFEDIKADPTAFMQKLEVFARLPAYDYDYSTEKNESGLPVGPFAFLHRLLYAPGWFNKLLRFLLPTSVRKKISGLFKKRVVRKSEMDLKTREQLQLRYKAEVERLAMTTDLDFSDWIGR